MLMKRRQARRQHVRRRRDHGRQRAGQGLRRRNRNDHRQRVRARSPDGKRRKMHGTRILEEADRLMTVCNSCRYCEGLCAVFPAMEMRRAFSDGDLNYLANLCHGCGACYTDCQFSPPHEFNVNVPKMLAIARAESCAAYAWPRRSRACSRATASPSASSRRLSVAAFIFGFAAFNDRQVLFGVHTGPGAFYKLMPHNAMAALFGAAFLYAIVALAMGVRAFWRDIGEPIGMLADAALAVAGDEGRRRAALSRWRRRRLRQRGRAAERPPQDLSPFYVLRLCAVLRLDLHGDAVSLSARARGAVSVVGPAGGAGHARRHRAADRAGRVAGGKMEARSGAGRPAAHRHGCRVHR